MLIKTKLFLSCPNCKADLTEKENHFLKCLNCKAQYPIINDIPVLMVEESESKNFELFWNSGWRKRVCSTDYKSLSDMNDDNFKTWFTNHFTQAKKANRPITTLEKLNKGKVVLNIGCGLIEPLSFMHMGFQNYIGMDFSIDPISFCHGKATTLNCQNAIFLKGNAESIPIQDNKVDVIYTYGVLHHTPNTDVTISEIRRVLQKENGIAYIGLYNSYSPQWLVAKCVGTFKKIKSKKLTHWFSSHEGSWQTKDHTNPWTKTYSKREISKMLQKNNLRIKKMTRSGFLWGNMLPKIGKYIDKTKIGGYLASFLEAYLGSMWFVECTPTKVVSK